MTSAVVQLLEGEWNQTSSKNFGEFLKALGIGSDMADKLDNMSSSEVWTIQGDQITLTLVNPNRTVTHTLKLGEKVVEQTGGTGNYTCSYVVENDKLINHGSFNEIPCTGSRQVIDGKLHWEFCADNAKVRVRK